MKRFLLAALLGVTLFTLAGPVFAEVETARPSLSASILGAYRSAGLRILPRGVGR